MSPPGSSRGGPLATDRPTAENPGKKFNRHGTPSSPPTLNGARAERVAGAGLADEAAGAWWRSTADEAILAMADRGHPFTADDLRDVTGLPEATNPRALGARFLAAANAGRIVPVGYTTSRRPGAHCAVVRVWRGAQAVATGGAA